MNERGENKPFFNFYLLRKSRKAELLIGNVVFILLNLLFLTILVLFLLRQGNGATTLEQTYAKQIALLIDSAEPIMIIKLDMEKGRKLAESEGVLFSDVVRITGNTVVVKLSQKGGYSYSFFNDVDARAYPDIDPDKYILTINEK